jgi:hypothetical protein
MSFVPQSVQNFLAPPPPPPTALVISAADWHAKHPDQELSVDGLITGAFGPSQTSVGTGKSIQRLRGSDDSVDVSRTPRLLRGTAVWTADGDHEAPSVYPNSIIYEHIVRPQGRMDDQTEAQNNHPKEIRLTGVSILTETGSHPTNAIGIEFGTDSKLRPIVIAGLSAPEAFKLWENISERFTNTNNESAPNEDVETKFQDLSCKFPSIDQSINSAITDVMRTLIRSPTPVSVEESQKTLGSNPSSLGQTANQASIHPRQTWVTEPK